MAKYSRIDVIIRIREAGIVPIFFHRDPDICKGVIKSCFDAGLKIFEFTNRGDFAHELFSDLNKWAEKQTPGMILGAGTIVDAATTALFIQTGANFIVSPIMNEEMARVCNRRKILWIPGCGSLSEISQAEESGAEIVKIFPGLAAGGPDFIRAVKGPCPWTSIMPTGGVEPTMENMGEWFSAGATCVGIGSNLFTKDLVTGKEWKRLTKRIAAAVKMVKMLKTA